MLIMESLVDGLEEFADKDLQERLWLHGDRNEMSTFEEACSRVFDDSGLTRAVESGYLKENYSESLCKKIRDFDQLLNVLPVNAKPEEVIHHPKMKDVRQMAGEILELFSQENRG